MAESIPDAVIRTAAFEHVRGLRDAHGELTSTQLAAGFQFRGERIPLINPQRGTSSLGRHAREGRAELPVPVATYPR